MAAPMAIFYYFIVLFEFSQKYSDKDLRAGYLFGGDTKKHW